jgi:hypothetical protein
VENWIAFAITLGLVEMTDYLPLLILFPIWILAIKEKKDASWWKRFLMSHIILVIFAFIWSPIFIKQLTSGINVSNSSPVWVSVLGSFSIKDILLIPAKFAVGRVTLFDKKMYLFVIGIIVVLFGGLFYQARELFHKNKLILLWLTIPFLVSLIISVKIPVLNYFRFLFLLPAFYLLLASGLLSVPKKYFKVMLFVVLAINLASSFMYLTNKTFQRENWRGAVKYVEANKNSKDVVIFPADSQMEAYRYYAPNALIYGPEAINKYHKSIWLVRYAQVISNPSDTTRLRIEGLGYKKTGEFDFNGVTIWKYTY